MWGYIPQAYKACTCSDSRPEKEPGVSHRDINGLMDGGAYSSKARSWNDSPPGVLDLAEVDALEVGGGGGGCQLQGELMSQIGSSVTRETSRGARPSPPL